MAKIVEIHVFFNANQQNGVAIKLTEEHFEDLNELMEMISSSHDEMWQHDKYHGHQDRLHQMFVSALAELGQDDELSVHDALLCLGAVYTLERNGRLESDDFNGIQLVILTDS